MTEEIFTEQEITWGALYDRLQPILQRYGSENHRSEADYWLLDENLGPLQHVIFINNLAMLQPQLVLELQALLPDFPSWEIVVTIATLKEVPPWPSMGLYIRRHEVIDGLRREFFPPAFRNIVIPNSKPGTETD